MKEGLEEIQEELEAQRHRERELLGGIAAIASPEFAEKAAGTLGYKRHMYGFEAYLTVMENLKTLLEYGMPEEAALEGAQSGCAPERVAAVYRLYKDCQKRK